MAHRMRMAVLVILLLTVIVTGAGLRPALRATGQVPEVVLAYVRGDTVVLADVDGDPVEETGPSFTYGQGARLFWTPDGRTLYIARDDGLFATGATGGAATQLPGFYSRTLTIAQDAQTLYYLETVSPQVLNDFPGRVSFPLRELQTGMMDGGAGRLAGYFGRFQEGAARADLNFAAALYVRDGGLLGSGRPNLWPTYGTNVFGTCCFPDPGLGMFDVGSGAFSIYDDSFIAGAAAVNLTRTHLAGPTTDGDRLRVIDLITGGTRDYVIEMAGGLGTVERVAWSPDDTYLYFISRYDPDTTLVLDSEPFFPVDTRSANIVLYRLNLVTSVITELAWRGNVYGVSSLAATDRYVFAVVVDPNSSLVAAFNARQVRPGALPSDPDLAKYMPATHLWRVSAIGSSVEDVADNVWGLAARPVR